MSTALKNVIAQKILAILMLVMSTLMYIYVDYDITAFIVSGPVSIWFLITNKPILEMLVEEYEYVYEDESEDQEVFEDDYFYFY